MKALDCVDPVEPVALSDAMVPFRQDNLAVIWVRLPGIAPAGSDETAQVRDGLTNAIEFFLLLRRHYIYMCVFVCKYTHTFTHTHIYIDI